MHIEWFVWELVNCAKGAAVLHSEAWPTQVLSSEQLDAPARCHRRDRRAADACRPPIRRGLGQAKEIALQWRDSWPQSHHLAQISVHGQHCNRSLPDRFAEPYNWLQNAKDLLLKVSSTYPPVLNTRSLKSYFSLLLDIFSVILAWGNVCHSRFSIRFHGQ